MVLRRLAGTVLSLIVLTSLAACGSDKKNKDDDTSSGTKYAFTADVAPIVKSTCSASGCHGTTAPAAGRKVYEDNEANLKADKASIISQLNTKAMPQAPTTISDADKKKLIDFLNQ